MVRYISLCGGISDDSVVEDAADTHHDDYFVFFHCFHPTSAARSFENDGGIAITDTLFSISGDDKRLCVAAGSSIVDNPSTGRVQWPDERDAARLQSL